MVKRISINFVVFATSVAMMMSAVMISNLGLADARVANERVNMKRPSTKADIKKKRLKKKRMSASTSSRARYIAQNDLESDLESDLDSDLNSDLDSEFGETEGATDLSEESELPVVSEPTVPQSPAMGEEVQITDIQYDSKKAGGTVLVTTSSPATYRTREIPSQNQVIIEIANAKLPEKLKRPFNTKDFKQATVSINAYQEAGSNTARIVLQYRQPRSVDVKQNERILSIVAGNAQSSSEQAKSNDSGTSGSVAKSTSNGSGGKISGQDSDELPEESGADSDQRTADEDREEPANQVSESAADEEITNETERSSRKSISASAPKSQPQILGANSLRDDSLGATRFYGRPISIEVRDTPVREVITLIADQSGANLIMSDDIGGNITIKLRQVPWDQALSIVMKTRSLGYVRQGSVLRIAPIRQLQAEADEARRILEAQEATLPLTVKVIPVSFAPVGTLAGQIRSTLQTTQGGTPGTPGAPPATRGRIEADNRSSSLIVTDTEENVERIEKLVKALDTAPLQVMIEGKIVEAKEDMGRGFGINWGYSGQDIPLGGLTFGQNGRISTALPSPTTDLNFRLGTLSFFGDLDAKLALFERQSKAKIISSPRVVTMNAQQATIDQAIQIPVPTQAAPTAGGTTQALVSVNYRPVPTTLTVTPQITSGGDVLMSIAFRREFLGSTGENAPIESRTVNTNVMVKNGQTAVIGGVYQSDTTEVETGTPYLRNIPILGWLFKSSDNTNLRNELLVFITPRILNAERTLPKSKSVQ